MKDILRFTSIDFLLYLGRQFLANGGVINASALTYTTLFAVVPLMTVSYAILAAVPSFQGVGEQVQGWIFSNFVPTTGEVVQEYLRDFAAQAQKLTAVGIGFLVITSVMMMRNIEVAFNRIWRVSEQRKGMSSFLLYWAVLSLGPVLIGLGLLLTSYLASLPFINDATELVGKGRLLALLPVLLSATAFTLLYAAVPNCKVPLHNALIGGVVVAILFETAKRGFALYATQFPSYQLIYGAFAAVPLFLFWVFISWVIILMGCELTRALTVYQNTKKHRPRSHLHAILSVLYRLWLAQQAGETLTDEVLLKQVPGLDQSRWDDYASLLQEENLLRRTQEGSLVLSRDLSQLSVYTLVQRLPWPLPDSKKTDELPLGSWQQRLNQQLANLQRQRQQALDISLTSLFSYEQNSYEQNSYEQNSSEQTGSEREKGYE